MTYDELTIEQKADLATFDSYMRSTVAGLFRVLSAANVGPMTAFAASNVDPVTEQLGSDETIPNSTGYAGAKPLTVAEFKKVQEILVGLRDLAGSEMLLLVKAAGVNAG